MVRSNDDPDGLRDLRSRTGAVGGGGCVPLRYPTQANQSLDRTSKFAFVQLVDRANTVTASAFLDAQVEAVPYDIRIVLTDNGIQFTDLPKNRNGLTARFRGHPFNRACQRHDI